MRVDRGDGEEGLGEGEVAKYRVWVVTAVGSGDLVVSAPACWGKHGSHPSLQSPGTDRFPSHIPTEFTASRAAIPFLVPNGSVRPSHPTPRALVTCRCPFSGSGP